MNRVVVVDTEIESLGENRYFDPAVAGKVSHTILPWCYLAQEGEKRGMHFMTGDVYLRERPGKAVLISHMNTPRTEELLKTDIVPLVMVSEESPLIAYRFYFFLKKILKPFKYGYLFVGFKKNVETIGKKFIPMYFPEPYSQDAVIETNFASKKLATMICGNKRAVLTLKRVLAGILSGKFYRELYKERLDVVKYFSANSGFDLYGIKWDKPIAGAEEEMRPFVNQCYRGAVDDKLATLAGYKFTFALENTVCPGYVTEKIFDAMFAGTVPVYLGAPDITDFVPKECFVDMRDFKNYGDLEKYLDGMAEEEYEKYIQGINDFINSDKYRIFSQEYFIEQMLGLLETEFNQLWPKSQ